MFLWPVRKIYAMKIKKRNRMKEFDYLSNNIYFVTACVQIGNVIWIRRDRSRPVRTGVE